jgi:thiamine pyrophosphate-dependent acetolactate synthase large subunit-like protein
MTDVYAKYPTATGATEVARFLSDHGYTHVFGLPGSQLVSIFYELQKTGIEYVPTIHESVTLAAADGYARVKGSGIALLYMLPGTANALANLYNASRDESPVLAIASQQLSTARSEFGASCEGNTVPLVKPFCRFSQELTKGTPVRSMLEKALRASTGQPGGPAFLSITEDVMLEHGPVVDERQSTRGVPATPDVNDVVAALRTARKPLIVAGGQLARYGGREIVARIAKTFEIPVAYEMGLPTGLGIAPGHSHCVGNIVYGAWKHEMEADVVLLLGARSAHAASPRSTPYFPAARFVGQVNTDPAKLEDTQRVDWVSVSHPGAFAEALFAALSDMPPSEELLAERRSWVSERTLPPMPAGSAVANLFDEYRRVLPTVHDALDHGWVVEECVLGSAPLQSIMTSLDGRRFAGSSGASLGWATGAAVGIAVASGEPVTAILGDGSVRFGAAGLWTIAALNLPITLVVFDNNGYASTRMYEREYVRGLDRDAQPQRPSYYNMDMRGLGPSVASMIAGYGIPTRQLSLDDDPRAAVEQAWKERAQGPNAVIIPMKFED